MRRFRSRCTKRIGGVKKKASRRSRHRNPTRSRIILKERQQLNSEGTPIESKTLSLFKKEKHYEEQR